MTTLFDSASYPVGVPARLNAGDRWAWQVGGSTAAYTGGDFTLAYRFNLLSEDGELHEIAVDEVSGAFVVEFSSTDSKAIQPGEYFWQLVAVRDSDSEEVTLESGHVVIRPSLAQGPSDTRSHTYKVLRAIQACIEGTADKDQQSYTIAGRSLSRRSIPELLELEALYSSRWEKEKDALAVESGRSVSRRVLVKMSA